MAKSKNSKITIQILLGMALGLFVGLMIHHFGDNSWAKEYLVGGVFQLGGKVFVNLLKMLVVPLVFVSLVVGTASLEDVSKLGRLGFKTLILYICTTAIAVSIAIFGAALVKPGRGMTLTTAQNVGVKEAPSLSEVIANIVPANPIRAMADGEMLQVLFFAIFFGIALALSGKKGELLLGIFRDLDVVIMRMVNLLILAAPYGVFFLIAKVFSEMGFDAIMPMAKYFFTVLAALIIQALLVYPSLLRLLSGLNPVTFFKKFKGVPLFAFSTSSSNATLPVTLEHVTEKLGVSNSVASFTIPLGATINMDGTAIMQGVATVFISQVYNIDIGIWGYFMVVVTATLASIGTAGVPGVGLITLAMVLRQVNLPVEGIALIMGVDRLLDMARTIVNVTGDAIVSCVVAKSEKQLDMKIFNQ